jgi:hypothetical protein
VNPASFPSVIPNTWQLEAQKRRFDAQSMGILTKEEKLPKKEYHELLRCSGYSGLTLPFQTESATPIHWNSPAPFQETKKSRLTG